MNLTVVVTNFGRAKFLRRCLDSVVKAGCWRIVVSSMKPGSDELDVIKDFQGRGGIEFDVITCPHDLGINELWLRGLYYAATPYVLILHDDDYLDPKFGTHWANDIEPQLETNDCGFASWRGAVAWEGGDVEESRYILGETRVMGSSNLSKILLTPGQLPVSPVVSVFRRDDAIQFLKEANECNRDHEQFTRPNMMLGNELLLYLRVCEKWRRWFYLDKALTYYGAHEGSETVHNNTPERREKFLKGYDKTRALFRSKRAMSYRPKPRLLHVANIYEPKDAQTKRRVSVALDTWKRLYEFGQLLPFPVTDTMLGRSSKTELNDTRTLPYLKDMFDWSCRFAQPEDIVIFSNSDVGVVQDLPQRILAHFECPTRGADFGWRHNFYAPIDDVMIRVDHGFKDGGVDLVAFKPWWWQKYRDYMPDMIVACEAWDWVMRLLVEEAHPGMGVGMSDLIFHEWHDPIRSTLAGFRSTNPGQVHNIRLARDFFVARANTVDHRKLDQEGWPEAPK